MQLCLARGLIRGIVNNTRYSQRYSNTDTEDTASFKQLSHFELEQPPIRNIHEMQLQPEIEEAILRIQRPVTLVQSHIWPLLFKNLDLVVMSSLTDDRINSYLIPLFAKLNPNRVGLELLVLSNSADNAYKNIKGSKQLIMMQKQAKLNFLSDTDVISTSVSKYRSSQVLFSSASHLNELLESKLVDIRSISGIIVESVDNIQDSGYENALVKIFNSLQPKQRIFITKSWQKNVTSLTERLAPDALKVRVSMNIKSNYIKHLMYLVPEKYKAGRILSSIKYTIESINPSDKSIILTSSDRVSEYLDRIWKDSNINFEVLRESSAPHNISEAIHNLSRGTTHALISTTSALRYLKQGTFSQVYNYSCPTSVDEYKDRMLKLDFSKFCRVSTILSHHDTMLATVLMKICEEAEIEVPPEIAHLQNRLEDIAPGFDDAEDTSRFERQNNEDFFFDS